MNDQKETPERDLSGYVLTPKTEEKEMEYLMESQACGPIVMDVLRELKKHQTKYPDWDPENDGIYCQEILKHSTKIGLHLNFGTKEKTKAYAAKTAAMCIRLIREL